MTALMPNAVFVGFTGTPLLKKDKQTTLEVFGGYIHTYKFSEAVEDNVVLDLVYEARDIDQRLTSQESVDEWFEIASRGLNDWQKEELKTKWGTMQSVQSSASRMRKVVQDVMKDFRKVPRLDRGAGNAILVTASIRDACKYYSLFHDTPFRGKCAIVTSYNPLAKDVSKEETGANSETDRQFIYNTYTKLLDSVDAAPGMTKTETYEDEAKKLFTQEPGNMKLLVVVDKLLTGFDAPSCTYLYIDKSMQDHGLFQAICRTNRLDGEDKEFGYIVDYKDLFKKVENAIAVYTSEVDDSTEGATDGTTSEVLLQERLRKAKERLDNAIEAIELLCEKVKPPGGELEHIHYFCGNTEIATDLKEREPHRAALYKSTVAFARAWANLADEFGDAGYTDDEVDRMKGRLDHYIKLRDTIRNAAGETLDLKAYEADMRHLIDNYIEADEPRKISPFDDIGLLDLIVKTGIADAIAAKLSGLGGNQTAVAETIENNVRKTIIQQRMSDPTFFDSMSAQLDEVIAARKSKAIKYEEYLKRIAEIVKTVDAGKSDDTPSELDSPGRRAIFNVLKSVGSDDTEQQVDLAMKIDETVRQVHPDGWRGVQSKEQVIKAALYGVLQDVDRVEELFEVIKQQKEF